MPRKRKGLKREPNDGDPSAASTSNHTETGTVPTTMHPALPVSRQPSAHPLPATDRDSDASHHTNKRARHLAEAEEDRLGKLVGLERWIESIGHGRGAAVCICAHLIRSTPSAIELIEGRVILELNCFQADDPARCLPLHVQFLTHDLARKVAEPLLLLHRLGPPAVVYLSGFAAEIRSPMSDGPRVAFQHHAVLKMSPQPPPNDPTAPTSAIWIEQLAAPPSYASTTSSTLPTTNAARRASAVPAPTLNQATSSTRHAQHPSTDPQPPPPPQQQQQQQPQPQHANAAANAFVDPSPPIQLSDWFSTPAPADNGPVPPNQASSSAAATATAAARVALPPPPQQPRQPDEPLTRTTSAPGPSVVKCEAQLGRSSSSPHPARPSPRQASTSAAPSAQSRRNAPHVKPRRMGNCLYTPMSMVRDGERASLIGVVVAAGDPRRSSSGTRDLSIKITIADASCLSGTGYAKELARSMTVMLFAQQGERIPQTVKPGHIVAVRSVQIQMFGGKPQAVGKSAAAWSWATYDPVSGDVRASSNFSLASQTPPECSAEEMEHFRDMANWFSELQSVDANIITRSSRPTLKLHDVGENTFFDTVVEVLKVYTHTLAPDLYVTDYTNHALFYRGNDKYLRLESDIPYPDDTDGWGHVFQISLWDSHATIAEGLQTGDIIRIQNVRPKLNPRGLLTGGLGSSTDSGIKIRTLKPTDEARIDLENRRARFLETLFTAEEEAFADRVERESERQAQTNPQVQHSAPEQPQHQEQSTAAPAEIQQQPAAVPALQHVFTSEAQSTVTTSAQPSEPAPDRQTAATMVPRPQSGPTDRVASALEASPVSTTATQAPFPTPAQRQLRTMQEETPSKTPALGNSDSSNRDPNDSLGDTPDLKPYGLMGPPGLAAQERRALIRCIAPAHIPLTPLAELKTSSLCPSMYKVKARVISTNPSKVEQWARVECKACKRLIPLDQRFCTRCGDEEGESLTYCLRFALGLEETDAEYVARKQQHKAQHGAGAEKDLEKVTIPVLFYGQTAEKLLPCIDAKAAFNGERSSLRTLRRFHTRLLRPDEYGTEAEQVLAVHSYWSDEAGGKVRRFAAVKERNCLHSLRDLL